MKLDVELTGWHESNSAFYPIAHRGPAPSFKAKGAGGPRLRAQPWYVRTEQKLPLQTTRGGGSNVLILGPGFGARQGMKTHVEKPHWGCVK